MVQSAIYGARRLGEWAVSDRKSTTAVSKTPDNRYSKNVSGKRARYFKGLDHLVELQHAKEHPCMTA